MRDGNCGPSRSVIDRNTDLGRVCGEIASKGSDNNINLAKPLERIVKKNKLENLAIYDVKTKPRTAVKLTGYDRNKNIFGVVIVDGGNLVLPNFFNRQKYDL